MDYDFLKNTNKHFNSGYHKTVTDKLPKKFNKFIHTVNN